MKITTRRHGHDVYMYLKRRGTQIEQITALILNVNGLTIKQAAHDLGMKEHEFLILIGHLKKVGVIREVGIR